MSSATFFSTPAIRRQCLCDGNDELACIALSIVSDYVKVQAGKSIKTTDATTILRWVGWIAAAIPGCQVN